MSVQPSDSWLAHQPWCGPNAVSIRLFPTPKESVIIAAIFKDAEITGAPVTKSEWNFSTTFYFLPWGWPGFIVDKIEPPQNSPLISVHQAEEPPATPPPPMAELRETSDPSKELDPASAKRQFPSSSRCSFPFTNVSLQSTPRRFRGQNANDCP